MVTEKQLNRKNYKLCLHSFCALTPHVERTAISLHVRPHVAYFMAQWRIQGAVAPSGTFRAALWLAKI